jgi:proteic killer suppression protein
MAIKSFADKTTAAVFAWVRVKRLSAEVQALAQRKLAVLHRVATVEELRVPPGNRLEKLGGDRQEQWSIRINAQWRICFQYINGDALNVEIVDYH